MLTDKSLDEERYGDDVEYEEVENILPVLLEKGRYSIPSFACPTLRVLRWQLIDVEASHACDIR